MAAEDETAENHPENLLEAILERARERYIEENGEDPPEEFMEEARKLIPLYLAWNRREENREVYDALADE